MYEFFSYVSENFEPLATIIGSVVVGSSALCALIPGAGWLKSCWLSWPSMCAMPHLRILPKGRKLLTLRKN